MLNMLMVENTIKNALIEDIGSGDITTENTVPKEQQMKGRFIAKEDGVICGLPIVSKVFELVDPGVSLQFLTQEGEFVHKGDVIAQISGLARSILTGERVALNFLQRMSAIATSTNAYVKQIQGSKAVIADTRKTTPGLRGIEKYAVKVGGGSNHRFNLADGVLIKDNHIASAGGITNAVTAARNNIPHTLKIEVEVESFEQIKEALEVKADIIMLDNMSLADMKKAVEMIDGKALTEASGNMGEKNLADVAKTGVDIISIGALTHTVKAMDISLRLG